MTMAGGTLALGEMAQPAPRGLRTVERNANLYACCPTCSKHYLYATPVVENNRIVAWNYEDLLARCRRCGGPLDYEKAKVYGEEMAAKEHRPDLTRIGDRMRALQGIAANEPAAEK